MPAKKVACLYEPQAGLTRSRIDTTTVGVVAVIVPIITAVVFSFSNLTLSLYLERQTMNARAS